MTDTDQPAAPVYVYKPTIGGSPWTLRLGPAALEWSTGYRAGRAGYRDIARIRMMYRPGSVQSRRFLTEIRAAGNPKLSIASTSYTGLVQQQEQDAEYSAFIVALHRRVAEAGGNPSLYAGSPDVLYWPGVTVVGAALLGFVFVVGQAVFEGALAGSLIFIAFAALFAWQGLRFFWLNRPRRYSLDAPPQDLLPKPRRMSNPSPPRASSG